MIKNSSLFLSSSIFLVVFFPSLPRLPLDRRLLWVAGLVWLGQAARVDSDMLGMRFRKRRSGAVNFSGWILLGSLRLSGGAACLCHFGSSLPRLSGWAEGSRECELARRQARQPPGRPHCPFRPPHGYPQPPHLRWNRGIRPPDVLCPQAPPACCFPPSPNLASRSPHYQSQRGEQRRQAQPGHSVCFFAGFFAHDGGAG